MTSSFKWDHRATKLTIAASLALIAGVMSSVAMGVAWADAAIEDSDPEDEGFAQRVKFTPFDIKVNFFGGTFIVEYDDDSFDSFSGIDEMRAGGPLLLVGLTFAWLTMVLLVLSIFIREFPFHLAGGATALVGSVFLLLALILLSVGISQFVDDPESGLRGLEFGAGFALTIVATVTAIAASVLAFFSGASSSGAKRPKPAYFGSGGGKKGAAGKSKERAPTQAPGSIVFD